MKWLLAVTTGLLGIAHVTGQEWARAQLESSPRHHEWVTVSHGERKLECFLAFPEVDRKTTAVVVIHENRGLTDWVRSLTDQLAEAGYVAIAPDLLSGMGPDGGKTDDFADSDAARSAIYDLPPEQVTADLDAVVNHIADHPASNGTVAVAGFCWGGSQTFRFATNNAEIAAALVFYGTAPEEPEALDRIECPVYGFYGENDARVTSTVPATEKRMARAETPYEPVIYDGAGHAFMRAGDSPDADEATQKARDEAWERLKTILNGLEPR